MDTIDIYCRVLFINPDTRQYQQNSMKVIPSPVYEPNCIMDNMSPLYVRVPIPLDREYIANYSEFRPEKKILAEIGFDDKIKESAADAVECEERVIKPILTVKGVKLLRDLLQEEEKDETDEVDEELEKNEIWIEE